jgi:hypothetical protein
MQEFTRGSVRANQAVQDAMWQPANPDQVL